MKYLLLFFIFISLFLVSPVYAAGQFTQDLFFGMRNSGDVIALQNFLKNQGIYNGPVTGNFYVLTRESVKVFQKREHIEPVLGYFGRKTRARVNEIFALAPVMLSTPPATTPPPVVTPPVAVPSATGTSSSSISISPVVVTPPPVIPTPILQVSGSATSTFPNTDMTPLKIGEFLVNNTTGQDILFANFDTVVDDEMDSPANRSKKVNFILRDGTTTYDAIISQTSFTFISAIPQVGQPYLSPLNFPFGVLVKAGQQKTVSLWVEQLGYVKNGILRVYSTRINTTSQQPQGGFNFTLTRT